MPRSLIVGIGNPGGSFSNHRHNLGFRTIDYLSSEMGIRLAYNKKKSVFGIDGESEDAIVLLKPQTFANLSGESVLYLASFLKIDVENIVIIFDNPYAPFGEIEFIEGKKNPYAIEGIAHGAVESLRESLNSSYFNALSVGIGPIRENQNLEEFCLNNFTREEKEKLPPIYQCVKERVLSFYGL